MKTLCPACSGAGVIVTAVAAGRVAAKRDGSARIEEVGSAPQEMPCRTCDGSGWLEGLKPPV